MSGLWCDEYANDITGQQADIATARAVCCGDKHKTRENIESIVTGTQPQATFHEDRIETPQATIYKDPPHKLYE